MAGNANSGRRPVYRPERNRKVPIEKYLPKTPPLPGELARKKRAGKEEMSVHTFHRWLWEFTISHGKNRLPKDDPRREALGITVDPFQIMKSLKKNAGLNKHEQGRWDRAMKDMETLRAIEEKDFNGEKLTGKEKDTRKELMESTNFRPLHKPYPNPGYQRPLQDHEPEWQYIATRPLAPYRKKNRYIPNGRPRGFAPKRNPK